VSAAQFQMRDSGIRIDLETRDRVMAGHVTVLTTFSKNCEGVFQLSYTTTNTT
jgi:hypothetical protein